MFYPELKSLYSKIFSIFAISWIGLPAVAQESTFDPKSLKYDPNRIYEIGESVVPSEDIIDEFYIASQQVPVSTPPVDLDSGERINTKFWSYQSDYTSNLETQVGEVPKDVTIPLDEKPNETPPDATASEAGDNNSYLLDISTAGYVSSSTKMSGGFIITGGSMKVLITAKGSNESGVDPLNNPRLEVVPLARDSVLAANTDWISSADSSAIDSSGLMANYKSTDAAIILTLNEGAYLADVFSEDGDSGGALVEVFDLDAVENKSTPAKLLDISTSGMVLSGSSPGQKMTAGFIISGGTNKRVLITAKGSLEGGINTLNDPRLEVLPLSRASLSGSNNDWTSSSQSQVDMITKTGFMTGYDSTDAAIVLTLDQGAYLVDVFSEDSDSGKALVEVFDLDILVNDLNMVIE
jgi:hypothetical protein